MSNDTKNQKSQGQPGQRVTEQEIAERNAKLSTESLERAARADGKEPIHDQIQQPLRSNIEQQGDDAPGVGPDGTQLQHRDGSVGYLDGYRSEGSSAGPPDPPLMGNRTFGSHLDAMRSSVEQFAPRAGEFKLVRIKPTAQRQLHSAAGVTITKAQGWVKLRTEVAEQLRAERIDDVHPDASSAVFDVVDPDDAKAIYDAETMRVAPAGTPMSPRQAMHDERPMGTARRRS